MSCLAHFGTLLEYFSRGQQRSKTGGGIPLSLWNHTYPLGYPHLHSVSHKELVPGSCLFLSCLDFLCFGHWNAWRSLMWSFVWLPLSPFPHFPVSFINCHSTLAVPQCLQHAGCASVSAARWLRLIVCSMLPVPQCPQHAACASVSAECCLCLSVRRMLPVPRCLQNAACASVFPANWQLYYQRTSCKQDYRPLAHLSGGRGACVYEQFCPRRLKLVHVSDVCVNIHVEHISLICPGAWVKGSQTKIW